MDHFLDFCEVLGGVIYMRRRLLIWLVTRWEIWSTRNDIQFNATNFQVWEVMHKAKLLSWLLNVLGISKMLIVIIRYGVIGQ